MLIAQPLADRSVFAPFTVPELICENDVQVGLERVVQPPDELQVIPTDLSELAASDWLIL
jgi:hypothetical protein